MFDKEFTLANIAQSQLRAKMFMLRIETGAYKDRLGKSRRLDGTPLTEDEVLKSELGIVDNHVQRAQDHLEWLEENLHKQDKD